MHFGSALLPGIGDCTSGADATRTAPLCYQGLGIALLVRTLRERLRSVTRDWGLGIALLVRTLRERLRSVTRDWGLGIGD
ncbi:MAG: hypothetical protein HEQ35_18975 [Gloeotrichia echinulata IR180]|nr:hypothetical protein [Gloeotrichia echinulata DEX184]